MKFDKLVGIGCSFSEGGGLNNPTCYKYYNGIDKSTELFNEVGILEEFMYQNSYIAHLSYLMDIPYENLSESRSSNELIIKKIYDRFQDNNENILLILQPTFFSRKRFYYNPSNKYINLNGSHLGGNDLFIDDRGPDNFDDLLDLYKKYLLLCYDEYEEEKEFYKTLDVYLEWLSSKNVTTIILPWVHQNANHDNILLLDNTSLEVYVENNKLKFSDMNMGFDDCHISLEGNKIIANKIFNYIQTL